MRDFSALSIFVGTLILSLTLISVQAEGSDLAQAISIESNFPGQVEQEKLLREAIAAILKFKEELEQKNGTDPEVDQDEDPILTVPEVIQKYGYPVEKHEIVTDDGYILGVHRIPWGLACGEGVTLPGEDAKRVVWVQHGLMGDSSNWVITGNKNRGLAFELADGCYDVWLGNYRGNTYSKKHSNDSLTPDMEEFWNFSWHEMGIYDIPASITYALAKTGREQLYYIGHSMGTTAFFVGMSEKPEFNDKIKLMSALAPPIYMPNTRSLLIRAVLGLLPYFEKQPNFEILNIESVRWLTKDLCKEGARTQPLCVLVLNLIGGFNDKQMDLASLPSMMNHSPAGCSSKAFLHYGQSIVSGEFRQYKDGPAYDISKITAPIAMYYGANDFLVDKVDVLSSLKYFADGTVKRVHLIEDDACTHLDFIWALDQHTLINKPVMDFMEEFTNPKETTTPLPNRGGIVGVGVAFWVFIPLVFHYV